MKVQVRAVLAAAAALLPATSIQAQQPPRPQEQQADEDGDILVTGNRDAERRTRQVLRNIMPRVGPIGPTGQIPRFESPVCPAVLGLGASQRAAAEARIRQVAAAAGLPVRPDGCQVNMLLMIVDRDTRDVVQHLRRRHIRYLGTLRPREIRRLANQPGPAIAWHQIGQVTARGSVLNDGGGVGGENVTTEPPTRMVAPVRPIFEAAAVVVERRALAGLTVNQLADYAAMRLLARVEPSRFEPGTAPHSILTVIEAPDDSQVPLGLTSWDLGFLRGLYSAPDNLYAGRQQSEIIRGIFAELERAEGPAN